MLTLMPPDTAGLHGRASHGPRRTLTDRRRDGDTARWGAQHRDGGNGRREHRARRVNDFDRAECRERGRYQVRVHGGGPRGRGRPESYERGGEGEEGGRFPATTSAAAASDGDGHGPRRHRPPSSGSAKRRPTRSGRVVGGEEGPHHRGGGNGGGAGDRRGGRCRCTPDHVQPGPPDAVGGEWRVDGGLGGFNATGGDAKDDRHRRRRGERRRRWRRRQRRRGEVGAGQRARR